MWEIFEWTIAGFFAGIKCCCALLGFFVAAFCVFWGSVSLFVAFSEESAWLAGIIKRRRNK